MTSFSDVSSNKLDLTSEILKVSWNWWKYSRTCFTEPPLSKVLTPFETNSYFTLSYDPKATEFTKIYVDLQLRKNSILH